MQLTRDAFRKVLFVENTDAMELLRSVFPDGRADEMNFVLFSTSGIHGTYGTIEECWNYKMPVTFLLMKPRILSFEYGTCPIQTLDDRKFLLKLRRSSHAIIAQVGRPEC